MTTPVHGSPGERGLRLLLEREGLDATVWGNAPRDRYAAHRHAYDKVLVAVAGSIVFQLPGTGRDVELRAGDRLDLPALTTHAALVGDAGVACLEAHLPAGTLTGEPRHQPGWGLRGRSSADPGLPAGPVDPPDPGTRETADDEMA